MALIKKNSNRKNLLFCQLRMCLYQNAFDVDNDCGGTIRINEICMEVGISNRIGWGSKEGKNTIYI